MDEQITSYTSLVLPNGIIRNILLWYNCSIMRRGTNITAKTFIFQKGNWNIFFRNIVLKLVLQIFDWRFKYCEARPPRFVAKLAAVMGHAMFIVTCGETSDPHPWGVNITRPCRALSLTHLKHSTLHENIACTYEKPSTGLFVETWFSKWIFSWRKGGP